MEKSTSECSAPRSPLSPGSTVFSGETLNEKVDLEAQVADAHASDKRPSWWAKAWYSRTSSSTSHDDETRRLKTRKIEECPRGYPRLACFLSSDHNFSIYRSFSYLHSRLLLNLQDEIRVLEKRLDTLDRNDDEDAQGGACSMLQSRVKDVRMSGEADGSRQALLKDLKEKVLEYDELLLKAKDMTALQQPSNRDYRSVRNWLAGERPLVDNERSFVEHREDIITLRNGRECAGFDGFIESSLRRLPRSFTHKLFLTPELREKTTGDICYFSASRVDTLVNLIITTVIFVLLILPVVGMYELTSSADGNPQDEQKAYFRAIGLLVVFTLLFGAAMSILTRAKRHELFAASAAYCAVLVVFIGNFGPLG